jgi:Fic family protein
MNNNPLQNPPYTITPKAADFLPKIVESATKLELGTGLSRDTKPHGETRMKAIHSSLAIVGNGLSLDDVKAVIDGRLVS